MSSYGYCYNNPVVLTDPDGMKPGYPGSHNVAKHIINYNIYIYYAFEGSNNTSTIHFHNHSKGLAGSDARGKAIGAIGEGIFATRLTSKYAPNSSLSIGYKYRGFHHDLLQETKLFSAGHGAFQLKVNHTDQDGNRLSSKMDVLGGTMKNKRFGMGRISYEVKTNNPDTGIENIFNSFSTGVQQVTDRSKVVDAAVLVFDYDSFQVIRDLPATQALIKKLETNMNKRGERTTYLNLERNLSSESNRAYHALKDQIKNE
jgi:hypothetical protein